MSNKENHDDYVDRVFFSGYYAGTLWPEFTPIYFYFDHTDGIDEEEEIYDENDDIIQFNSYIQTSWMLN